MQRWTELRRETLLLYKYGCKSLAVSEVVVCGGGKCCGSQCQPRLLLWWLTKAGRRASQRLGFLFPSFQPEPNHSKRTRERESLVGAFGLLLLRVGFAMGNIHGQQQHAMQAERGRVAAAAASCAVWGTLLCLPRTGYPGGV